jgi:radical SAM superfamily enzyme with C-terminal helix-hairpin-helix motif
VLRAITLVNEVGAIRRDGIPELLPGLNFIGGLAGETAETYDLNEEFLARVLATGLLVRRVNIRQLMAFEGTRAYQENTLGIQTARFRTFKERVRKTFDLPMLRKVFPVGTVLRSLIIEQQGPVSFGRQMGSYPILTGVPLSLPVRTMLDAVVVDHGMRSVTALPAPIRVNELPLSALKWIPGISIHQAGKIFLKRPVKDRQEFRSLAGITPLEDLFSFVTSP